MSYPVAAVRNKNKPPSGPNIWYLSGNVAPGNIVAAYQPIGAASQAASYTNLANPGVYTVAPANGFLTWSSASGWIANGLTFLHTGIFAQSGWSAVCRFSNIANSGHLFGSTNFSTWFTIQPSSAGNVNYGNGNIVSKSPVLTDGVLAIAGTKGYRNGVVDATGLAGWSAITYAMYILAYNWGNSIQGGCNGRVQAIAFYNTILNDTQVAAISASMAALTG